MSQGAQQDGPEDRRGRWRLFRVVKRVKRTGKAVTETIDALATFVELLLIVPRLLWAILRALGDLFNF